jgi:hypothetical protein
MSDIMQVFPIFRFSRKTQFGVYGQMFHEGLPLAQTYELPWRANQQGISCIPAGVYEAVWEYSPKKKGFFYELKDVPGRGDVQVHTGNHAGHTEGCILPGLGFGPIEQVLPDGKTLSYLGVWNSRMAYNLFLKAAGGAKRIMFDIRDMEFI